MRGGRATGVGAVVICALEGGCWARVVAGLGLVLNRSVEVLSMLLLTVPLPIELAFAKT